ncbi:hypothetical protein SmJEL517_g03820 [Synchytrium microbalum]|uniref:U three protein 7 n=1 Tax=Synchytrium microbalum TaxID=1806994 RepID=A0A507BUV6_9FUNG|nr:uncharacterized protein SmJEL517_g03820 [Synchytrium microbalum]TPX33220.1 hypothetical protein SmJEL517_g03820 [Synchytrium microbalum]
MSTLSKDPARPKQPPRQVDPDAARVYNRGVNRHNVPIRNVQDLKLKTLLRKSGKKQHIAVEKAVDHEMLLPESAGFVVAEGMERTWRFKQHEIEKSVDVSTSNKMFDLDLPTFGPYCLDYTRNGRWGQSLVEQKHGATPKHICKLRNVLIGGKKGHIATFNWRTGKLGCEIQVKETIRDVKWLHNETMFAVAQKKYVYIYDNTGLEVHCLRKHLEVNRLEFLPYHFLLASVGNAGYLKYQDTSTGNLVAELRTGLGRCDVMAQNPYNAIMQLGHTNGTVTLWSPNMTTPLVKMLCHKGPVSALAVDRNGLYMASAGLDGQLKIWDIRTFKPLQSYYTPTPASSLAISELGLLAVGFGPHVHVWKDAFLEKQSSPYMTHLIPGSSVQDVHFCPYEDILGVGHAGGISSLAIPGSGEPNFDSLEANPYQNKKQRRETEVHSLLDKIQPEMIAMNPEFVGTLDRAPREVIAGERKVEYEANNPTEKYIPRPKARGRSSSLRKYLRKQTNVIDSKREAAKTAFEKEERELEKIRKRQAGEEHGEEPEYTALDRFAKKAKS